MNNDEQQFLNVLDKRLNQWATEAPQQAVAADRSGLSMRIRNL
jgi:hypothetical protein